MSTQFSLSSAVGSAISRAIDPAGSTGNQFPVALFSTAPKGIWYDPSDFASMFQDSAGTTPVTAVGQPVGLLKDKSGNAIHQLQATAGSRPLLQQDGGGNYYLDSAGGKSMASAASLDLTGTAQLTLWAGMMTNIATGSTLAKFGDITANAGSFDFGILSAGALMYHRAATTFAARGTSSIGTTSPGVFSCLQDLSGTTYSTECPSFRYNGSQPTLADYGTGDSGTGNFGTYVVNLFTGQGAFNGRMYGLIVLGATSTQATLKQGEAWMAGKTAVSLPFEVWPTAFSDTNLTTNRGGYLETSAWARTVCTTSATTVTVTAFASAWGSYPTFSEIGVVVNGVYNQSVSMPNIGTIATTITLPAGANKTVEFVSGLQTIPTATLVGTWVVSVTSPTNISQTFVSTANRMLVYGDSITVGANSTPPTQNGWFTAVRYAYAPKDSALEAWGFRKLFDDCIDAAHRTTFTATVQAYSPSIFWMAIGTNDYGISPWAAAAFGVAYADLLDKLHAAMPSLLIYCQTPIVRNVETANGSGSTLSNYRTQISTAVSTRTGYCTLVDGTTFMTTASLDADGVHPTTAGHALYATAVRTVLGV